RLNYQPDYVAQRMVMKKSKTNGVIVPDITNPFFAQLIRGIESVLYKENFILMLCNAEQDVTSEHEYLTELIRRCVD
ncbi:LacI family transcriptional regulator, partial [Enterococcus faecalis]